MFAPYIFVLKFVFRISKDLGNNFDSRKFEFSTVKMADSLNTYNKKSSWKSGEKFLVWLSGEFEKFEFSSGKKWRAI